MSAKLSTTKLSIVIVVSEFNHPIIENLLKGAQEAFFHHGGKKSYIRVHRVPGAFEIPGTIRQILKFHNPHAIVALGAVIRGETSHFDYVAGECARGVADLSIQYDIPIMFGVLTTENLQQALERAGTKAGNKGWEVMEAALQTIQVYEDIQSNQN